MRQCLFLYPVKPSLLHQGIGVRRYLTLAHVGRTILRGAPRFPPRHILTYLRIIGDILRYFFAVPRLSSQFSLNRGDCLISQFSGLRLAAYLAFPTRNLATIENIMGSALLAQPAL